jgi:hypothetical protein
VTGRPAGSSRSILACLVHEAPDCVADLVANLRFLDPAATVLLYDGGTRDVCRGLEGVDGVVVHPGSRPTSWGLLHTFAVDCLRYAGTHLDAAAVTFVDSDQLLVRPGYSEQLLGHLAAHPGAGCLVSSPAVQPPGTLIGPAQAAWSEVELWRPFLRRFPAGEDVFPHWTFWPGTVFTRRVLASIVSLWDDGELQAILDRSGMWAAEEVVLPTLAALTGHRVAGNPFVNGFVRYRREFSAQDLERAFAEPATFWMHPVRRSYVDTVRARIRERWGSYGPYAALARQPPPAAAATVVPPGERPAGPGGPGRRLPKRRLVSAILSASRGPGPALRAIDGFLRQQIDGAELIVVDGPGGLLAGVLPDDDRVRYHQVARPGSLGDRLNAGCAQAWGEFIAVWDDRTWTAPWRLAYQVQSLQETGADVVGLASFLAFQLPDGPAWRCGRPPGPRPWVAGASACFRRSLWEGRPFPPGGDGLDGGYLAGLAPGRVTALGDPSFLVRFLGPAEAQGRPESGCQPLPEGDVQAAMGRDWDDRASWGPAPAAPAGAAPAGGAIPV